MLSSRRDRHDVPLDRREFTFDGYNVDWKGPRHAWKAEPGTHVLRLYLRWFDKKKNRKIHLQRVAVVRISGWEKEGGYRHPGLSHTQEELDRIRSIVSNDAPSPMKTAWERFRVRAAYSPHPHRILDMHNFEVDRADWDHDGGELCRQALKWAVSADDRYADNAVGIMRAWANTWR